MQQRPPMDGINILNQAILEIVNNADVLASLTLNNKNQTPQQLKAELLDTLDFMETTLRKTPHIFSIAYFYPVEDQVNNSFLELLSRFAPKPVREILRGMYKADSEVLSPESDFIYLTEALIEKALKDNKIGFMEKLLSGYGIDARIILQCIDGLNCDVNLLLHAAAENGCFLYVKTLMHHAHADVNHILNNDSVLLGCIKSMIRKFNQDYDDLVKLFVDGEDRPGGSGFGKAYIDKWDPYASLYSETMKLLIAAGADPGFLNSKGESCASLLAQASMAGNPDANKLRTVMQEFSNEFQTEAKKAENARKNALLTKTNLNIESNDRSYPVINIIQSFFSPVEPRAFDEKASSTDTISSKP